ncbi:hypothetical protein QQ045_027629 [Rhodiola kirilowii]
MNSYCFPKIKRPQLQGMPSPTAEDENRPFPIIIKNFNSLYSSCAQTTATAPPCQPSYPPLSPEFQHSSAANGASTPDLSAIYASRRFFISSPGQSNSIIDYSGSSASSSSLESDTSIMKNSVAVRTFSPDPYADFRRSMEEMVEARAVGCGESNNWDYLHELLLCYLALNPKTTHKFIIGAFADLVVDHMSPAPAVTRSAGRRGTVTRDVRGRRFK